MIDAIWSAAVEDLMVDAYTLCVKEDNLSDEEIAEYERRGWEQRDHLWTRTIRKSK